jgi:hypothetical protein
LPIAARGAFASPVRRGSHSVRAGRRDSPVPGLPVSACHVPVPKHRPQRLRVHSQARFKHRAIGPMSSTGASQSASRYDFRFSSFSRIRSSQRVVTCRGIFVSLDARRLASASAGSGSPERARGSTSRTGLPAAGAHARAASTPLSTIAAATARFAASLAARVAATVLPGAASAATGTHFGRHRLVNR